MADEKKKSIETDQETIKSTGGKKQELSEKDLDKASGGTGFEKWIEINKI